MTDLEFTICTECIRPEICSSRCECSIVVHAHEEVAKIRDEEAFMEWIKDHTTDRDINRTGDVA